MRLTYFEAQHIIALASNCFGKKTQVYLFGSRVDDTQKGGDIDLYIIPELTDALYQKKIQFLVALKQRIGEQKIDVVLASDASRLIEKMALQEGIELNLIDLKIQKVLNECDKHLLRINDAYQDMQDFMPLTPDRYIQLSKHQIQAIDQYLYRFTKLQDAMGEKLFKLVINHFEENGNALSYIDILNKLEKLQLIPSANSWKELREIRNSLAHEYEDNPDEIVSLLNHIVSKKTVIEDIYLNLKNSISLFQAQK
ncbi:MAG: nucleotidyltransferase domain-containing protein [Methylococcaceae bacterium]|nr:nucleotidyltransferase domain-containing protein [Methylococcaceae bacterium]